MYLLVAAMQISADFTLKGFYFKIETEAMSFGKTKEKKDA